MTTFLKSVRVKNFKAVKDSGSVKLTPLTVFIGNNGSGKSSLIEGLQTIQDIVDNGLDQAMQNWLGFEHIWHKGMEHKTPTKDKFLSHLNRIRSEEKKSQKLIAAERLSQSNPMSFELRGKATESFKNFIAKTEISLGEGGNELFFVDEKLIIKDFTYLRNQKGKTEALYTGKEKLELPEQHKFFPVFARRLDS